MVEFSIARETLRGESAVTKSRIPPTVVAAARAAMSQDLRSDGTRTSEQATKQADVEAVSLELRNGLTRRQRIFILEKLVGLNDKNAALAAGYSLSVAENTKQRIWNPFVRQEFERLKSELASRIARRVDASNLS
jgi:hypothetical protein